MKKGVIIKLFLSFVLLYVFGLHQVRAQHSEPATLKAFKIQDKIKFDGVLSEDAWQEAPHINNFTQRDLNFGEPVSERTEVAVLYDQNTLYLGVWCYQEDVSKIVAKNMNRDFDYRSDDNFQVVISPFNDNRNGYLFVINPNGARADIQVYGGEDGNKDWNGVWDAKTTKTDEGWFAEVYIPFSTLQFKKDSILNWAINFERDIVSKNEEALWQGWSRDYSIYAVTNAGRLTDIIDIAYAKKFEFLPYLLAGWRFDEDHGDTYPLKAGGNLNVSLSPTLKLNLTSYTDFAQVESDRIPVNLSRFAVFYPEKRQFFLEGYDMYSYYLGDRNNAFYSRQIGVEDDEQVPIVVGARLFGKVGKNNIGFLNIQEGKTDSVSSTNNTVFRYKYDIGKQSYIGGIFTNKVNNTTSNQVFGIDAAYQTSKFLRHKNLVVSGKITTSTEYFTTQKNALTYRLFVDYPNDLIDNYMAVASMQKGFNPELGYIRRTDYNSYSWHLRISPRIFTKYGIKRMLFKPWGMSVYYTHSTGELESLYNETRPLGAVFQSGERFEVNLIQSYDRLDKVFEVTDEISIPEGKYWMYKYELQFETYQGRRLWIALFYNWGDFYTGKIKTFESELGVNVNKHLNFNGSYTLNYVDFPEEHITTNEIALYMNYAFTTKLNFSLFSQYNDLDEVMIYNFRLHWIPKIGSDLYFVYNIGYEEQIKQIDYLKPQTTDAAVKLVYRFVF
ncbi:MAG: carbohydrate binding family 9 domain-containing protein [Chlorobi bacterium]|nr:carbohydrate binding family 9 domain-containing protein [Chlorobiota bacterium]